MRGYGARNTRPLPGCPRPGVAGARRREFLTHRPGGRLTVAGPRRNLTGLPPLPSRVARHSTTATPQPSRGVGASLGSAPVPAPELPAGGPVVVVGIGADGWDGLSPV